MVESLTVPLILHPVFVIIQNINSRKRKYGVSFNVVRSNSRSCIYTLCLETLTEPRLSDSLSQHLIHPRDLRSNTVIDRPFTNLHYQPSQDLRVDFRNKLKLLASAVR